MRDLNDKVTTDSLTASEWDDVTSEIQQVIEDAGITLSAGDLTQLAKGLAQISLDTALFTDSGAANAYVLSAKSGRRGPQSYTDGLRIRFKPANANTGASTVNVSGLGVKNIKTLWGADPVSGFIKANKIMEISYDNAAGYFVISDVSGFSSSSYSSVSEGEQIRNEPHAATLDIVALIGSSFESVGPTGSGATNVWTAMDELPKNTTILKISIESLLQGSTNGDQYSLSISIRRVGATTGREVNACALINRSGSGERDDSTNDVEVPLDSNLVFEMSFSTTGTAPTTTSLMRLIGFKERLLR